MATFDTNVVVRLIIEDDPVQGRRAEAAWRAALADDGVFLPKVVVVETFWVLRRAYRLEATEVAAALRRLFDVGGVEVENATEIRRALDHVEEGAADFSDYVILESAREAQRMPVQTFDRRFAREEGVDLLEA